MFQPNHVVILGSLLLSFYEVFMNFCEILKRCLNKLLLELYFGMWLYGKDLIRIVLLIRLVDRILRGDADVASLLDDIAITLFPG